MDYYKSIYEYELKWNQNTSRSIGKAQGNLETADAILASIDEYQDPKQLLKTIRQARQHIAEANFSLNSKRS